MRVTSEALTYTHFAAASLVVDEAQQDANELRKLLIRAYENGTTEVVNLGDEIRFSTVIGSHRFEMTYRRDRMTPAQAMAHLAELMNEGDK